MKSYTYKINVANIKTKTKKTQLIRDIYYGVQYYDEWILGKNLIHFKKENIHLKQEKLSIQVQLHDHRNEKEIKRVFNRIIKILKKKGYIFYTKDNKTHKKNKIKTKKNL
tara:strand:- start:534 stop:863 length:330 start_codon:yes stop_codon:yes gene_type:complete